MTSWISQSLLERGMPLCFDLPSSEFTAFAKPISVTNVTFIVSGKADVAGHDRQHHHEHRCGVGLTLVLFEPIVCPVVDFLC